MNILAAPRITSDLSIRDMTVKAGEEFTITVPFTGSPIPKPVWSVNGEEIIPDSRIKFDTSATETVFKNKCAKRKTDTGNYTIHLINNLGADSASCKVLVVGKFLSKNFKIKKDIKKNSKMPVVKVYFSSRYSLNEILIKDVKKFLMNRFHN